MRKKILHGDSTDTLQAVKLVYRTYCADPEWCNEYGITDPGDRRPYENSGDFVYQCRHSR
jgi:hypothetical protein